MKISILFVILVEFVVNYDPTLPLLQDDFKTDVEYSFDSSLNLREIYEVVISHFIVE